MNLLQKSQSLINYSIDSGPWLGRKKQKNSFSPQVLSKQRQTDRQLEKDILFKNTHLVIHFFQ